MSNQLFTERKSHCKSFDGLELYYQSHHPVGKQMATLVIVHGFSEHSGRYRYLFEPLTRGGVALYGFDLRGHGRSAGRRGHITKWREYLEDLKVFLDLVNAQEKDTPIFLLGHSMGGLIVLDYLGNKEYSQKLQGVILSAPPLKPSGVNKPHLKILAYALSFLYPTLSFKIGVNPESISREPAGVIAYHNDPFNHGVSTTRTVTETLAAIKRVSHATLRCDFPCLFSHGDADPLTDINGSKEFFARLDCPDKEFNIYSESRHEPHNDLDRDTVIGDYLDWIRRRTGLSGAD